MSILRRANMKKHYRLKQDSSLPQSVWEAHGLALFFTEGTSSKDKYIADLQRRACWISLALILQFLNELINMRFILPGVSWYRHFGNMHRSLYVILPILLLLGSFFALWQAFRPVTLQQRHTHVQRHPLLWQQIMLLLSILMASVGFIVFLVSLTRCFQPMQFTNDGTVLDINAAAVLLQGRDPYQNQKLGSLALHASIHADWMTPLRTGRFAGRLDYPSNFELQYTLHKNLQSAQNIEFESKVSYPAFSFLTLLPFAYFKVYNVLLFYVLCHVALIVTAWKCARPELRPWLLLLSFANVSIWTATAGETLDMLYTLFVALAWLFYERRYSSVLFLGIAIASKQIAWFFLPFYFIMIWQQYNWKEAVGRIVVVGSIGLLINLPFILWDPQAWFLGILAPMVEPMFPLGTGIIALSTSHILPYLPNWCYTLLEGSVLGVLLFYYWQCCRKCHEAALLLAILPLFFAWRSLPSYFYCSAFPLLVFIVARRGNNIVECARKEVFAKSI